MIIIKLMQLFGQSRCSVALSLSRSICRYQIARRVVKRIFLKSQITIYSNQRFIERMFSRHTYIAHYERRWIWDFPISFEASRMSTFCVPKVTIPHSLAGHNSAASIQWSLRNNSFLKQMAPRRTYSMTYMQMCGLVQQSSLNGCRPEIYGMHNWTIYVSHTSEMAHYYTSYLQFSCCQRCHCRCCRRVFASHTNSSTSSTLAISPYILHDAPSVHFDNNRRECIQHSSGNFVAIALRRCRKLIKCVAVS